MPSRPAWLLVLAFSAIACCSDLRLYAAEAPRRGALPKYEAGKSYFVGGSWFQYAGTTGDGADCWLYPHLDGTCELFTAVSIKEPGRAQRVYWQGDLESRFQPETGAFANLWGSAEALNEALNAETAPQRQAAARLLAYYQAIRGGAAPYHLREHWPALEKHLNKEDLTWVGERATARAAALKAVPKPGTAISGLSATSALDRGPREYYRRMLADGYLDICIVGGNMYDDDRGTYNSWAFVEELRKKLDAMGLKHYPCRLSADKSVAVKTVRLLGQNIVLRIRHTGGSTQYHRIVRGVANFVEGLAHADVFIYHGHSNLKSGAYYVSESIMEFSRFQVGMGDTRDLGAKCHGLKQKSYQLIAFQSCVSFEKYARHANAYYLEKLPGAPGAAGFLGNSAYCYFVDFAPRYAALIESLLGEKGPRTIAEKLDAIRPHPQTPNLIYRGILQPEFTFIVPAGVKIEKTATALPEELFLISGTGSDGRTYLGTGVFPQDRPGEVVQLARTPEGLFGLYADGSLKRVGPDTGGAAKPAPLTRDPGLKFVFISASQDEKGNAYLLLAGNDGRLYVKQPGQALAQPAGLQPPQGTQFVAAGRSREHGEVAQDKQGHWHTWDAKARAFAPLKTTPALLDAAPSLLGHGLPGHSLYFDPAVMR